ncbi:F-box/LRR-repeat protein At2g42720-like isoform X1 [Papaver somniferum]|uniref:F-box/LRR-repeat protein At2g42720-like isoform X1 n=1 Tax=Papaver somniferum TaxID=3469 RepID=UPI000E6F8C75|nr:F-box/LRR-repeat protein At2g42720-like isoform X1 [Papaver somniferum]XP_026447636.1 F-box/LRR-repeat protein At2g42720-like isoform X1 [Papaver somniferum]
MFAGYRLLSFKWDICITCYFRDLTRQFFSNLPVLEELELTDCQWNWFISEQLSISAPALKYLSITGPNDDQCYNEDFPSYEFIFNIFAPNLQSLRYTDIPADDYILHRSESLVDAEIDFKRFGVPLPQGEDLVATEVLEKLSNVKLLKISGETFEALAFLNHLLTNWPMFHNLVHLEFISEVSFNNKNKTMLNFLRISPNLETIVIASGFLGDLSSTDCGWTPGMVPQCMLLHLKLVKLLEFAGFLEELNTVKSFLKNARVLRRMIIKFFSNLSAVQQNKIMKQLIKIPRGRSNCIMEVL